MILPLLQYSHHPPVGKVWCVVPPGRYVKGSETEAILVTQIHSVVGIAGEEMLDHVVATQGHGAMQQELVAVVLGRSAQLQEQLDGLVLPRLQGGVERRGVAHAVEHGGLFVEELGGVRRVVVVLGPTGPVLGIGLVHPGRLPPLGEVEPPNGPPQRQPTCDLTQIQQFEASD